MGHWYEAPAREQPAVLAAAIPCSEQGDQVNADRRSTHQWLVEDGEAVYWSNGKRAGMVSAPHLFNVEGERRDIAKRKLTCFEVLIGLSPDATRLCFARSKVKKIAAQNSPSPLNSIDEDIDLSLDPKAYGLEK